MHVCMTECRKPGFLVVDRIIFLTFVFSLSGLVEDKWYFCQISNNFSRSQIGGSWKIVWDSTNRILWNWAWDLNKAWITLGAAHLCKYRGPLNRAYYLNIEFENHWEKFGLQKVHLTLTMVYFLVYFQISSNGLLPSQYLLLKTTATMAN